MASISSYAKDAQVTGKDKLLGSSYEGEGLSGPIYETKNFTIASLASYLNLVFTVDEVNYNLHNLVESIGVLNNASQFVTINTDFANELVSTISTVPSTFTELALSNLDGIPQAFADFIFTIADINETFANQVLDLATSVAYATSDQFDQLEAFTIQLDTNVQGVVADVASLTTSVDANTGAITANATSLDALGVRVTTAEADVVALNTDVVSLTTVVNTNTGDILTNATSITTLGTVVDTATTDIATLKTDVTVLESSIDTVSGNVAANASDISLLTTNVDTVVADVTALETSVTTLETTVNTNTGDIATQATAVDLLTTRVDTAEADILNTATNVTTLTTTVDGNTGAIATNASDISILQTNVDTAIADITAIQTDITTLATSVDENTGAITANATQISGLATNVALKPNVFYQISEPAVTEPVGSLWYDTDDGNKGYILVAGSPNVWTEATDARLAAAQADITNLSSEITTLGTTVDTNTGNISTNATNIETLSTSVTLLDTTVTAIETNVTNLTTTVDTATGNIAANATAISTLSASVDDNTASITTNAQAIATTDGKLTASYGVEVNAGGKVAGLKLLADGTTTSSFIAQADTFGVEMPNGTRVLTVNSSGLSINGSGTFSGALSAATGSFSGSMTAGLVDIETNNITLGNDGAWGTVANISFENGNNDIFAVFKAYSSSAGDGVQIIGGPTEDLDSFRVESQAQFLVPASNTFAVNQGAWAAGLLANRWQSASVRATDNVAIGIGPQGSADTGYLNINAAASGLVLPSIFSLTSGSFIIMSANSGASFFTIEGSTITLDGNVTVTGTLTEGSDESIKTNVVDIPAQAINARWVKYNPISNQEETRYGVVAQELEINHPELVRTFEKNGQTFKSVAYIDLLVAKIAELESRIQQLENNG